MGKQGRVYPKGGGGSFFGSFAARRVNKTVPLSSHHSSSGGGGNRLSLSDGALFGAEEGRVRKVDKLSGSSRHWRVETGQSPKM